MKPVFLRNIHQRKGMSYRVNWHNWMITLFLLVVLLALWLFAAWMDESAERARLEVLETKTVDMLNGVTMRIGPSDYVTCRQVHLIRGIDETGI
jgi:hypothetical protein